MVAASPHPRPSAPHRAQALGARGSGPRKPLDSVWRGASFRKSSWGAGCAVPDADLRVWVLGKASLGIPCLLFLTKFGTESEMYISRRLFPPPKQSLHKAEERNAKQKKREHMSEALRLRKDIHRDCLL